MLPGSGLLGSLPCGRYLLAPSTGNKEGNKGLMVFRVWPTPIGFPANSLYTPIENTVYMKNVSPMGLVVVAAV